ncbi:MAG: sugar phosphate isomerase/epimerase [Opitutales bacterium]|nr:sugar phosphate isomerase/epimerase [Opitutales bacterium]
MSHTSPIFSVFPKFLAHLPVGELARRLQDAGADAVDLIIRRGFWVEPDQLAGQVPAFVQAVRAEGLDCRFATWGVNPSAVEERDLQILVEAGIRRFRLGHFSHDPSRPYPEQIHAARKILEQLVPLLERYDAQAVYQVHHDRLLTSPESLAFLVEGLPPERIGVMPDAGNQWHEGLCGAKRMEMILGDHWSDLGIKDVHCGPEGVRKWVPCGEGANDWRGLAGAWGARPRRGLWNLQPFYAHQDQERHLSLLAKEITYLRRLFAL